MKHRFHAFLSGALCATLILGVSVSALAISGRMTIDVDPINIQVNGETFVPRDVNGREVPVFAYDGTTYAPLRALAEAYGLEVGYDAEANMATVQAKGQDMNTTYTGPVPDEGEKADAGPGFLYNDWSTEDDAAYQEFKGMWDVNWGGGYLAFARCIDRSGLFALITNMDQRRIEKIFGQYTADVINERRVEEKFCVEMTYLSDDGTYLGKVAYNGKDQRINGILVPADVDVERDLLVNGLSK